MFTLNGDKLTPVEFKKVSGPIPRNERDYLINEFTERLKAEWRPFYFDKLKKKHKVQPWTIKRVAIKLAYIKNLSELYYLLSTCKDAKGDNGFTKMFNYLTKSQSLSRIL